MAKKMRNASTMRATMYEKAANVNAISTVLFSDLCTAVRGPYNCIFKPIIFEIVPGGTVSLR